MQDEILEAYLIELKTQHELAVMQDNSSSHVLKVAFHSNNGDVAKSIAAAMLTLGGLHAPIEQTWRFLRKFEEHDTYPGFGNSFEKGFPTKYEGLWNLGLELRLNNLYMPIENVVKSVRKKTKKDIYPNLAFYTALPFVDEPYQHGIMFAIESRVSAWNEVMKKIIKTHQLKTI